LLQYSNILAALQQGTELAQNEDNLSCVSCSLFFYGQLLCVKFAKMFQYPSCSGKGKEKCLPKMKTTFLVLPAHYSSMVSSFVQSWLKYSNIPGVLQTRKSGKTDYG
jgi:hypothetical protein